MNEVSYIVFHIRLGGGFKYFIFPRTGLPVGFYLRKKYTGHAGGRAGLGWARFGPAERAGLGWEWGLAVLGALAGLGVVLGVLGALGVGVVLGVGFGRAGRAGWVGRVGRAGWVGRGVGRGVLAVLGALGWVGRGVWQCWARWPGWAWWSK